jgi:DDE_Tnp_1-associated
MRLPWGKVTYPLAEVLLLCLLAVLAGAESFTEIALFGIKKLEFPRSFRPFNVTGQPMAQPPHLESNVRISHTVSRFYLAGGWSNGPSLGSTAAADWPRIFENLTHNPSSRIRRF